MNAKRRKKLEDIWTTLENAKEEEEIALEGMPEGLAETAKGDDMQSNIDELEEAQELIRNIIER